MDMDKPQIKLQKNYWSPTVVVAALDQFVARDAEVEVVEGDRLPLCRPSALTAALAPILRNPRGR